MNFTPLRELFDNVLDMLNIVMTDSQKDATFKTASREFFSYVKPILIIPRKEYDELVALGNIFKEGYKDVSDIFGLGIGDFSISTISIFTDEVFMRISPMDYEGFKLKDTYAGAYQFVLEYFFKKVEKDNYGMLESAGINMAEHIEVEDINTIRDYLRREFGITVGTTIGAELEEPIL